LQELSDLADNRKIGVEVAEVFPREKAADAFRSDMEGHTRGKIVVAVGQNS
jgi:NADPH:quinone reductase-like Zn-dependent oxidoreductase